MGEVYKKVVRPTLRFFPSESAHIAARELLHIAQSTKVTRWLLRRIVFPLGQPYRPQLATQIAGMQFENPVMVGAGWDKPGRALAALFDLDFAGTEIGTITPLPQKGNRKPRQWMVDKKGTVAIQSLGFPNKGVEKTARNLQRYQRRKIPTGIIGISVGINKQMVHAELTYIADKYAEVAERLSSFGDYLVVNVSSPNTPLLRDFQNKQALERIVETMRAKGVRKPIFLKISPDILPGQLSDVIAVAMERKTGIIIANTTLNEKIKAKYRTRKGVSAVSLPGGLSGDDEDYRAITTKLIKTVYRQTRGKVPIIGSGGVKDAATAIEKIRAGASIVQVVTAIRGEGPRVAVEINKGIARYLKENGYKNVRALVGLDAK